MTTSSNEPFIDTARLARYDSKIKEYIDSHASGSATVETLTVLEASQLATNIENTRRITFDPNAAILDDDAANLEGSMEPLVFHIGESVTLPSPTFTCDGYYFPDNAKVWLTTSSMEAGTVQYSRGETATFNDDTTLYASWWRVS